MKLSKLYCNKPDVMEPVFFKEGLNVVIGEVHRPREYDKDTHNLGKTTLGKLLDFALLAKKTKDDFLFKHPCFLEFVFFLEIELPRGNFLTIRRSVANPSKISLKKHANQYQDLSSCTDWDHSDVSFEAAKKLTDGLLDWQGLRNWSFRQVLSYLLRSQDGYKDVFHQKKSGIKPAQWKPFLAFLLGLDSELMQKLYEKKEELAKLKEKEKLIRTEFTEKVEDLSTIEGLLLLKSNEAERKQALLDAFDFRKQDLEKTDKAVNDLDANIAAANVQRYRLTKTIKQIEASLAQGNFSFDLPAVEQVFKDMQILFAGQIKKDFNDLISFNKDISQEREKYLKIDLGNKKCELDRLNREIDDLGIKRAKTLEFIKSSDVFEKYKMLSAEMTELRASVEILKEKQKNLKNLQDIRAEIRALTDEYKNIRIKIEDNLEAQSTDKGSRLSEIRLFFNEIVETVIDQKALLTVSPANDGSLEFDVNIVDEDGRMTSAGDGHSYGRLLCVAFDLAVLRAHIKDQFPMFVFHDGVFETWDDRKKQKLLEVIRRYASMGLQPIVTAIDADLPAGMKNTFFNPDEIILRLHDRDDSGRLFKMPKW